MKPLIVRGPVRITRLDAEGNPIPGAQQLLGEGGVFTVDAGALYQADIPPFWGPASVLTIPLSPANAEAVRMLFDAADRSAFAKARLAMLRRKIGSLRRKYRVSVNTGRRLRRLAGGPPSRRIDSRRPAGLHRLGRYL